MFMCGWLATTGFYSAVVVVVVVAAAAARANPFLLIIWKRCLLLRLAFIRICISI